VEQDTTYVAFDTSKETLAVAIAEGGRRKEVRFFGTIANRPEAVCKLVEKLAKQHRRLAFCYEAGPAGYGLYRQLRAMGHDCQVVAPSMVLVRPGGHIKTDRRDATTLAALFLAYVGTVGRLGGLLLWPCVVEHATVALLLVWTWRTERMAKTSGY
jgi:transposase